ncbi:SDR family NAD(P)-dependent oxidoreductase [Galactobacter valiniphilus]|uniref:SDR family NAD(P)-dependent oxidoreductase n=1 Tax=Galactobacter valiniphilus TaxID=2676122 RepID=A0A399J7W8_9MICC|nr:sugar nucleotide-binding protein [Galactobacter valiniphilus]RII41404.1 SDR family NAD(P)-dependent oxidoreductase [Galactobacter valiniphilus]
MSRVLLIGCGALGTALGAQLLERGDEVVAVRRDPSGLPTDFVRVAVDLAAAPPAGGLPEADAAVITLPPISLPDGENGAAAALRHLRSALPSVPARTILVSSTRVFDGAPAGAVLTEADAPVPGTERARALVETEEVARELFGGTILRPAGIYGPGRDFLLRTVREGRPANHARLTNRIHEADLVRTLRALLDASHAPAVLHAVDQAPAPLGEVLGFLARRLGVPVPADAGGGPDGRVFDGAALLALLGSLEFPGYREGYEAMLEAAA